MSIQRKKWRVWEEEFLAPILSGHPDAIRFTAYEELSLGVRVGREWARVARRGLSPSCPLVTSQNRPSRPARLSLLLEMCKGSDAHAKGTSAPGVTVV